jgi:RimJ/RimL family protein N-acetyltransferase
MGSLCSFGSCSTATHGALRVSDRFAGSTGRSRTGRVVDVRPLEQCDRPLLEGAIGRLSEESRSAVPHSQTAHDRAFELDRLVDLDHHDHEALIAIDPSTRRGVAVVRYIQVPGEPGVVELAATVAEDWHGMGLGSAPLTGLMRHAFNEGHLAVRAYVLAATSRSIAMLRRAGFRGRGGAGTLKHAARVRTRPVRPVGRSSPASVEPHRLTSSERVSLGFGLANGSQSFTRRHTPRASPRMRGPSCPRVVLRCACACAHPIAKSTLPLRSPRAACASASR